MNKFWKITGAAALLLTACSDSSDKGSPIAPEDSSPSIVESSSAITGTESSSATIEQSSSSAADSAMVSDKSSSSQATSDGSVVKDGEITDLRDGKVYKTTTIGIQQKFFGEIVNHQKPNENVKGIETVIVLQEKEQDS